MQKDFSAAWTPVALSADLPVAYVIPARIETADVAVWRAEDGTVSAVADRCPHRGMRLSHGFVRGEALSCIYHGWRYGKTGHCLAIPAHPGLRPPEAIRVTVYRVAERDGVIWVSATEEPGEAPAHEGFTGLRSITLSATAETLAGCLNSALRHGTIDWKIDEMKARLLTTPSSEEGILLAHLLIEAGATQSQKRSASIALEALRRAAEAAVKQGEAA
ncbi:Rieske (2Fe-2S) protein [Oryzifoliimicrobium ureilyticus]|uniref:Rieske (2Fe-2S) protein n=1 Tax=Oryzifoliimicrobium ureilyticus TaxID=3113724 RepID=UPI0030766B19